MSRGSDRIEKRFAALRQEGRAGFVVFVTAGDPDRDTSYRLIAALPAAGADIIELGMPFTDPMADGPAIQASSLRALKNGMTLKKTLALVADFRKSDHTTPIVLMGYFNPIYSYGVTAFIRDALAAGVDGLIVVDLPPEEDDELCRPALDAGLPFIRLATPTTDEERLPSVVKNTAGFLYYVSVTGITGGKSGAAADIRTAVARLREQTELPIAVGFGIKTPEQAVEIAKVADAAVVGSAVVNLIADNLDDGGKPSAVLTDKVLDFVSNLAEAIRAARSGERE